LNEQVAVAGRLARKNRRKKSSRSRGPNGRGRRSSWPSLAQLAVQAMKDVDVDISQD
jgi:hypothetical protein